MILKLLNEKLNEGTNYKGYSIIFRRGSDGIEWLIKGHVYDGDEFLSDDSYPYDSPVLAQQAIDKFLERHPKKLSEQLTEELSVAGLEYLGQNNYSRLYKITSIEGFNAFGESTANDFGFTQSNWDQYMTGANAQTCYIHTDKEDNLLGMFLSSRSTSTIQVTDHITIDLYLSYEANDHSSSYDEISVPAPLHLIPECFPEEYRIASPGQLIYTNDNELIAILPELIPEGELVEQNSIITLDASIESIGNYAFEALPAPVTSVVLPEGLEQVEPAWLGNAIDENDEFPTFLWPEFEIPDFLNEYTDSSDGIEIIAGYGHSQEEINAYNAEKERAAQEAERQRIAAENQAAAQAVIDAIQEVGEVKYNNSTLNSLRNIQNLIDNLTEDQKALVTNLNDFDVMINTFNELKSAANNQRAQVRANTSKLVVNNLVFEIKNNQACLTYVKRLPADQDGIELTIPETVNNYPVTRIEAQAFSGHQEYSIINIPSSVNYIGPKAFINMPFTEINIPDKSKVKFGKDWR